MLSSDEKSPVLNASQPVEPRSASMAPLQSPLQQGAYHEQLLPKNGAGVQAAALALPGAGQQMAVPISDNQQVSSGQSPLALQPQPAQRPAAAAAASAPVDAAVWVERVKNVVTQTQNEPYKQAQMLQQLQDLYQKGQAGEIDSGRLSS